MFGLCIVLVRYINQRHSLQGLLFKCFIIYPFYNTRERYGINHLPVKNPHNSGCAKVGKSFLYGSNKVVEVAPRFIRRSMKVLRFCRHCDTRVPPVIHVGTEENPRACHAG